jgi:hypothetical protein
MLLPNLSLLFDRATASSLALPVVSAFVSFALYVSYSLMFFRSPLSDNRGPDSAAKSWL